MTDAERAHLDREGWLHLAAVADAATLAGLRAAWERLVERERATAATGRGANVGPAGLESDPAFAICVEAPRVVAAVRHLLGDDLAIAAVTGRDPPRGHGQQGLHADWPEPAHDGANLVVNAFWLLDDMDADNGATRVVPGSHRSGKLPSRAQAQPHAHHAAERYLEGRAGDVFIVSAHLWHSGTRNPSGRRRRLVNAMFAVAAVAARLRATYRPAAE